MGSGKEKDMIKTVIFDIGNVLTVFRWEDFIHGFGFSAEAEEKVKRATVMSPYWNELDVGVWSEEQILDALSAWNRLQKPKFVRFFGISAACLTVWSTRFPG